MATGPTPCARSKARARLDALFLAVTAPDRVLVVQNASGPFAEITSCLARSRRPETPQCPTKNEQVFRRDWIRARFYTIKVDLQKNPGLLQISALPGSMVDHVTSPSNLDYQCRKFEVNQLRSLRGMTSAGTYRGHRLPKTAQHLPRCRFVGLGTSYRSLRAQRC
jgi:hypothetical protein